jgi:glycoside/pentoside/hexuronide:cation symporter, GPH family
MIYLLYFYTDVFGISAAAAGTMFLVSRVLDGVNDPIVGMVADRTVTRWGKFRPYLLWFCVPFAVMGVLTFTTPDFAEVGKLIWAYVTYNALMILYTIINIPYTSMLGVISSDATQRTSLSSIKFLGAYSAGVVISALLLPMVMVLGGGKVLVYNDIAQSLVDNGANVEAVTEEGLTPTALITVKGEWPELLTLQNEATSAEAGSAIGITPLHVAVYKGDLAEVRRLIAEGEKIDAATTGGFTSLHIAAISKAGLNKSVAKNERRGWQLSFMIIGFVAILCFFLTFIGTRERVKPVLSERSPVSSDIKDLVMNKPWLILLFTTITFILFVATRSTATVHYFKYYVGEQNLALPFGLMSGKYGFEVLVSIFNVIGQIASIVGVVLLPFITRYLGKKKTFMVFGVIAIVSTGAFYMVKADQVELMYALQILGSITGGPLSALIWAMYADTADYGEWKYGRRATGLIFSASTMSQKFGWAIGSFIAGWLLTFVGFQANMIPTDEVKQGLLLLMSIIPCVMGLVFMGLITLYPLTEKMVKEMAEEVDLRRISAGKSKA